MTPTLTRKRKIRIPALPSQQRFFQSTARVKGFSGPIGSGKSFALCCEALRCAAENPGRTGLIGAPTFPMLRDTTVPTLLELLDQHGTRYRYAKSESVLTLERSQSRILLRSLDRPEHLRGTNLAWVGVDELTYCSIDAWQRLEARVRDPGARQPRMFAVWTPNGFDWVYRRFISPKDKLAGHEAILAAPNENLAVLSNRPDYYEQLKISYDDLFYRQEVLGEYLNINTGRVYHAWSDANEDASLRFVPEAGICWSLDFNVDPMAAIVAQHLKGRINVLAEIFLRNSDTNAMCERFESLVQPYVQAYQEANGRPLPVKVCGDATGQSRSTASRTDYELIREYFRARPAMKLDFDYARSNPPVRDRVNSVNAMFKNARGEIRIRVHPDCRELITDCYEVSWKAGALNFELDKLTNKTRTHVSDALGYLIWEVARIDGFQRQITRP